MAGCSAAGPALRPAERSRPRDHIDCEFVATAERLGRRSFIPGRITSPPLSTSRLSSLIAALVREPGVSVHVVLDNYGTHKTPAVKRWFLRHPEYHLHFIPTSSSWLNQVERFFARITEQRIRRGVFTSVPQLEKAIEVVLKDMQANPKTLPPRPPDLPAYPE